VIHARRVPFRIHSDQPRNFGIRSLRKIAAAIAHPGLVTATPEVWRAAQFAGRPTRGRRRLCRTDGGSHVLALMISMTVIWLDGRLQQATQLDRRLQSRSRRPGRGICKLILKPRVPRRPRDWQSVRSRSEHRRSRKSPAAADAHDLDGGDQWPQKWRPSGQTNMLLGQQLVSPGAACQTGL
jgi:hypothetical protein